METANLSPVVGIGLKPAGQLEQCKNFASTTYSVGIGQSLFAKPAKSSSSAESEADSQASLTEAIKQEVAEVLKQESKNGEIDLDVELSSEHVPLGEILERLQSEDRDKSNLIRLHAVNDSNATISATLNVATLDLSSPANLQHHLSEINDVLFNVNNKDVGAPAAAAAPVATSSSSFFPTHTLSPQAVPELCTLFNNNNNNNNTSSGAASGDDSPKQGLQANFSLSPQPSSNQHGYETKSSPQECNLCNKMFGNASALAKHRLTHSDERKYLCNVCHKAFKRQDHLNGHLLTHRNKKPFECVAEGCNKSYCDARSLRRHRENHHANLKEDKMVSPASSVASGDNSKDADEKFSSLEGCDAKGTKVVFTTASSVDKDKLKAAGEDTQQFQLLEQIIRETKESEASNAKVQQQQQQQSPVVSKPSTFSSGRSRTADTEPHQNMVECSICSRKFKNIPALNGHMRLHGGYYRKDDKHKAESKASQQAASGGDDVSHTVSSNVRALIEEKIIHKRKLETARTQAGPGVKFNGVSLSTTCSTPAPCSTTKLMANVSSYLVTTTTAAAVAAAAAAAAATKAGEPPAKKLALDVSAVSSLDNLSFPVLPQPDTSKLLANLQNKQPQIANLLPASPLPSVPLPNHKVITLTATPVNSSSSGSSCDASSISSSGSSSTTTKAVRTTNFNNLLKVDRASYEPRLGNQYQAAIPDVVVDHLLDDTKYGVVRGGQQMWDPQMRDKIPDDQFDNYMKLASSCAIPECGNNLERALSVLANSGGDIVKATQDLLNGPPRDEMKARSWSAEEVDMFYEALCKFKKDFDKISGELPNKSTKDCVEFYYLWKNICREESQSFKSIINSPPELDPNLLAI